MCYQPITIKTPQGYKQVPCGKCLECLRKYQSDWSNRMYEELKAHDGKAVFFTLTYDDANVPKNYLYYSSMSDYEIFRSPSDYGYDNTYIDDEGKEKVLPSRKGERKHKRVDPSQEVKDLGLDLRIIDFNVTRKDREKFRTQIKNIYGNYLRTINDNFLNTVSTVLDSDTDQGYEYDFDEYEGVHYSEESVSEEKVIMLDLFEQVVEDEEEEVSVLDQCEQELPHFRERPIMMFNSVRKKDVQDWIKRARQRRKRLALKNDEPEQKFTFFITSEYGPRTLRPHYHGVIFGLTAEESNDMKTDWIRHHGRKISWDNVDLSKGDMSYCAKYCSKGFYEHPLCSKDFFYYKPLSVNNSLNIRPFTEYHSKHYERCIEIFGIDAPIVDPTFHLVSKGLGVSWVDNHLDLVKDFKDIDFKDLDTAPTIKVAYTPSIPEDSDYDNYIESQLELTKKDAEILYDLSILKDISKEDEHILKRINREVKTKDYEQCIEQLFNNFKYYRTYKDQVVPYGVPKYYRTKIFSDGLRAAFTNYVQQVNAELYQEKFEQLQADNPTREDSEIVLMLEKQDREEKYRRMSECKKRLDKIYNKSKI